MGKRNADQCGENNPYWKGGVSAVKFICQQCGVEFIAPLCEHSKFCSKSCYDRYRSRNRVVLNCERCGKEFTRAKNSVVKGWGRFCSHSCASKSIDRGYLNVPKTDEHRRKISESNIRTKRGDKLFTDKEMMVLLRKGMNYRDWRRSVFEFDNYTCVRCGRRGGTLNAHHIDSFADNPEFRFARDNGITLCSDCHHLVHTKEFLADAENYARGVVLRGDHAMVC